MSQIFDEASKVCKRLSFKIYYLIKRHFYLMAGLLFPNNTYTHHAPVALP